MHARRRRLVRDPAARKECDRILGLYQTADLHGRLAQGAFDTMERQLRRIERRAQQQGPGDGSRAA